uniref:Peptidase A2 domain-containing protein n=1 Tax=Astyanax mexicanus TaxID=7994 RepID=A0A8B9KVR5_ASTMX
YPLTLVNDWCVGRNLDVKHAIVLSGVSPETPEDIIYKVLDESKVFGRTKISDYRIEHISKSQFILIETSADLSMISVPEQIGDRDEWGSWVVSFVEPTPRQASVGAEEFYAKLMTFLEHEGKTLADVEGFGSHVPSAAAPLALNTELVNAISSLVEKCHITPTENPNYRKLRLFSGEKPTPFGEEEYEAWAEQAAHMLEEWQCSDNVKKQRISESLKGPAADIVRFLRVSNPNATAIDYLKSLETAFGTTENASDLLVKFRSTFQEDNEKLSSYLFRLDKLLHSMYRKGGIERADIDRVRIDQVVRGALPHDLVALRIKMTYKLKPPPSFTQLLQEVREEEELEPAPIKVKKAVGKLSRGSVGERTDVPVSTRSAQYQKIQEATPLPKGLVGPSSIVPVQVEGVYAKALLDSGSQVTLLYRSF